VLGQLEVRRDGCLVDVRGTKRRAFPSSWSLPGRSSAVTLALAEVSAHRGSGRHWRGAQTR
jgi:hypothetical protein